MSLLLLMILIPLLFSCLIGCTHFSPKFTKAFAFLISLTSFVLLFFAGDAIFSQSIHVPWVEALSIDFYLKVDEISLPFLYLTAIIFPIVILAVKEPSAIYFALILFLQALLLIFFTARDLALFTIFWEATLIPIYFIMTLYGGQERQRAAMQFIIYMIAGGALMVAAILSLYFASGTFNLDSLQKISQSLPHAHLIFAVFLLAFAVKTPIFPFHAWLPAAYTESSVSGTIILSAVMSKMGIYGILRILMEIFPSQMQAWSRYILPLAIFSVLYGAFAAWMQKNDKRLIAFSSFSHVNFIVAGLFVASELGTTGSLLQVINHGVTIAGLFLVASFLEERIHSRLLIRHRGLLKYYPKLCWLTLIFVLASVSLPGTSNFIGELLILLGIFTSHPIYASILALSVILSVIYMLRYMELNFFGKDEQLELGSVDIGRKELLLTVPLIIFIILIGIYPQMILPKLEIAKWSI